MLLGALGSNLLENMLTGKRMLRASYDLKWIFNAASSFKKF